MSEKKVIAVIVEGPSDENAIGGILKEFFSSEEVQFAVVHGDITSNEFTTVDNVIRKIDGLIDGIKSKYGYHWDDFISFISDEAVAVPGTYKETWRFIEKDKHSLERHSNMNLIFEK